MKSAITKPNITTAERIIVTVPMSKDEAEKIEWEMRYGPHKGMRAPFGELLKQGITDLSNLAYAAEHAPDARTKAAARTLLAHQLGQPQTIERMSRHGPEVIGEPRYLEEKYYDHLITAALYTTWAITAGLIVVGGLLWNAAELLLKGAPWVIVTLAVMFWLAVAILPIGLLIRRKVIKDLGNARNFNLGREGEDWVIDRIRAKLDNRWIVFRSVMLPGKGGDIDAILVGPGAIYVLEVKAYKVPLRIRNGAWETMKKKHWQLLKPSPLDQANKNAMNLKDFLASHGVVWRYIPANVVLTQPHPVTNFDVTLSHVWLQFDLDAKLAELNSQYTSIAHDISERAAQLLRKEVESKNR
jgi:hypothetical protein